MQRRLLLRRRFKTGKMIMDKQSEIKKLVHAYSEKVLDPAGREVRILKDNNALKVSDEHQCSVRDIYLIAMNEAICPYRYIRNRKSITLEEQIRLAKSCVAVVGSGGLGGNVILLLARIGIGCLKVIDYDVFDETNLNRQALSDLNAIGQSKSEKAVDQVGLINPGVKVEAFQVEIDYPTALEIFKDVDVVVDALDNIPDRFVVENSAKTSQIPLVHGAIAGFDGQVMTIFPEDEGLKSLYGDGDVEKNDPARPGAVLGVPALTPSLIATMQAMEVIKILLNRGNLFRNKLVHIDIESGQFNQFSFGKGE